MSAEIKLDSKIYIAGHRGTVGTGIVNRFEANGYHNLVTKPHAELDLTRQDEVEAFIAQEKPEVIVLNAAVGANSVSVKAHPVLMMTSNIAITLNVLTAAEKLGVKKVIYTASATAYPNDAKTQMVDGLEYLEENEVRPGRIDKESDRYYVVPKITGVEVCRAMNKNGTTQCVVMLPSHIWGVYYDFDKPSRLSVVPALILRMHEAMKKNTPEVVIWGTGNLRRELLFSEDLGEAYVLLTQEDASGIFNVGYGSYITIREMAEAIKQAVGYQGKLVYDKTKPEATELKLLNTDKLKAYGWEPKVDFTTGIRRTYDFYLKNFSGQE